MKSQLLLFLLHALLADCVIYYVKPKNGQCFENGISHYPCYFLNELTDQQLSYQQIVHLVLFSGSHEISSNQTIRSSNTAEIHITSSDGGFAEIHCPSQLQAHFVFWNIESAELLSVDIHSCTLLFKKTQAMSTLGSVQIINCVFLNNQQTYSLIIEKLESVVIVNSEFHSSVGAVSYSGNKRGIFQQEVARVLITGSVFANNQGKLECGVLRIASGFLSLHRSSLINNSAISGGGICVLSGFAEVLDTEFVGNVAVENGGAVYSGSSIVSLNHSQFEQNKAGESGGALYFISSNLESYFDAHIQDCSFESNQAGWSGGALYFQDTRRINIIIGGGFSVMNSAWHGGFAYFSSCFITVAHQYTIADNRALADGGAILAYDTAIEITASLCSFENNVAEKNGGALFLTSCNVGIYSTSFVNFTNNSVNSYNGKGGAIYFRDRFCEKFYGPRKSCLVHRTFFKPNNKTHLIFLNNQADKGSVLYGGLLDRCIPSGSNQSAGMELLAFKEMSKYDKSLLAISSQPMNLCLCKNDSFPDCSEKELNFIKMRGEVLQMSMAALDQDSNPVPAIITAGYNEVTAELGKGEERRRIASECQTHNYHVFSVDSSASLTLGIESTCGQSEVSILKLHITLKPCTLGFEQDINKCVCDRRLTQFANISVCNISTLSVEKKGLIWLSYDQNRLRAYRTCPYDYCESNIDTINVSDPDQQCTNHRSGVLCGACQHSYSIVLGSSKCLQCASRYKFIWLLLVFAVAGAVLVAFLLIFNLTISAGTLNGLIFYVNVVSISGLLSLPNCSLHPILSVFIAWTNLDLGIETCFFQGMETFHKTWLQFAFPLYIWLLVGAIIVISYYSSRAMKIFGRNNIAILATLFLLSYSKILNTIITILTFSQVLVGKANDVTHQLTPYKVWTYDGNIDYLKGKHISLFVVAVLFLLIFFLPYTLALILGQFFRSMSVRRGLKWMNSTALVSILDAYHAPYHDAHRYWTGLLLLVRCLLFLIFATNYNDRVLLTNMYTIILVVTGVITIKTLSTQVYKSVYKSLLELCFLLNVVILSSTVHYLESKGGGIESLCKSITASTAFSLAGFICILAYHTHLQLEKTRPYELFKKGLCNRLPKTVLLFFDFLRDISSKSVLSTSQLDGLREALLESD